MQDHYNLINREEGGNASVLPRSGRWSVAGAHSRVAQKTERRTGIPASCSGDR
jgi:hypothetical protein